MWSAYLQCSLHLLCQWMFALVAFKRNSLALCNDTIYIAISFSMMMGGKWKLAEEGSEQDMSGSESGRE